MALGEKTGGRQKGTKNKDTALKEARALDIQEKVLAQGITPLEVIIETMMYFYTLASAEEDKLKKASYMRTASEEAQSAANYVHPKLASAEVKASIDGRLVVERVLYGQDKNPE